MSEKKIIAVVGATGTQGGGLVRAILDDPASPFAVRAITRNADSDRARELAARGAEVVEADLADPATLKNAFAGVHGAFVVTNFFESMSAEVEKSQAHAAAQALKDAGAEHVIWSTLDDTRPTLAPLGIPGIQGSYTVPHFDGKYDGENAFRELGVPTTFLRTTFYWESLTYGFSLRRGEDGTLAIILPLGERRLSGIAGEDIGRTAYGIFQRGTALVGDTVSIAGDHLTGRQIADTFAKVLGETVDYRPLTFDQFYDLGLAAPEEFTNMFRYYYEAEADFTGARDLDRVRALNPALETFEEWLTAHKDAFKGI
ncbi:NmrA/HSCARG family protein [Streptomyces sp. J2-1]|uniref:NmrA/HSCARG family protein n=1 Tax=Streptomyces corallincola TaxID=2851888 RepID=UPI001C38967B|nr:NmrA/HSCARG family protein [Streptomyces corallincola]MBV2358092.1 NmrA/HSCARG family protein [Streptomyces corallincola]